MGISETQRDLIHGDIAKQAIDMGFRNPGMVAGHLSRNAVLDNAGHPTIMGLPVNEAVTKFAEENDYLVGTNSGTTAIDTAAIYAARKGKQNG